jgi:hypothetical protein
VIFRVVECFLVLLQVCSLVPLFVDIAPIVLDAAGYCWHRKVCVRNLALSTSSLTLTGRRSKYFFSTHRETCANLFVLPYALNDGLDEQCIYLVVDVPLPHRVPNLIALNNFEHHIILQWLYCAKFISAFTLTVLPDISTPHIS